jgi:hypothetical protein
MGDALKEQIAMPAHSDLIGQAESIHGAEADLVAARADAETKAELFASISRRS